ncbi:MAG: DMT family transporter [Thermoleophilia bacterium]|jgi:paired small multidrug resistance pump
MTKIWFKLFIAAVLEVAWVVGLAHAYSFWTWTATIALIIVSNYLLITAAQILPTGTAYAFFVGLGAGGTVLAEVLFFGEPLEPAKILLIAVLLFGVIGLKLTTDYEGDESAERGCSQ